MWWHPVNPSQWVLTAAHCVVMGEGANEASYYTLLNQENSPLPREGP
ncbi:hypothetical protein P4S64_24015 [Vibrio sp. M60_M31a]